MSTPLRIFLSYGHDPNEELVRRIKTDLEKRGHDVWFDKSEIKFGVDWRRELTDGILKSNRVLSFLSKHSTRDPGVCRDEIAIALGVKGGNIQTILVESEQEVQPPVNIGHLQWLDMHDWKERRAADAVVWEEWYQAKFTEIVRVVESDESRRFAGEIETLNGHLKPIKSDARIYDLLKRGFFGRAWLFDAVEKWRTFGVPPSCGSKFGVPRSRGPAPQPLKCGTPIRLFWISGDPGVGKSAFAAQLTQIRSDVVIAAQFVEWGKTDHRHAARVVRSLAFQLATRLPDYRKLLLTLPEIAELDRKEPGLAVILRAASVWRRNSWLRLRTPSLYTPATGLVRSFHGHNGTSHSLVLTGDNRRAVAATKYGAIDVWDLDSGQLLRTLQFDAGQVRSLARMPEVSRVACGFDDGSVKLCDLDTGAVMADFRECQGAVLCLALASDGMIEYRLICALYSRARTRASRSESSDDFEKSTGTRMR